MTKRILSLIFLVLLVFTEATVHGASTYEVEFSDLVFTDAQTGGAVGNTIPKAVNITGNIQSTRESFSAWLVAAMYTSDGILVGVDAKPQTVNQGTTPITASVENTTTKIAGKMICFLWGSETTLDPVTKTAEFLNGNVDYHGPSAEYYVSVTGSSDGDGSENNPFDSIATAKEYIKTVKDRVDGDITVHVEAGEYILSEPLTFDYEDSATLGNRIIYQGEEGTVLSGGERVTGWTREDNGLYSVSLPDRDYVGELYVNNKAAQRSNTEEEIYPTAFYNDGTADVGVVVPYDAKLATIKEDDKAELTSVADWRCIKFKIKKVFTYPDDSSKLVLLFEDGANAVSRFIGNNGTSSANYASRVENAIGLVDTANEFYFDKEAHKLYYKPEYGVDPNNLEMYIPNLEKLLVVRGEHTGKRVTGLTFDGFDFRHTTWKRGETDDYYAHQGAMIYNDVNNDDYLFPQAGMVPAAVMADMVDGFSFTNNTVACVGTVGVGLYNGVVNSDVTGNVITQTAHSGVTVGVTGMMYSDSGNNVAYRKPATASSSVKPYSAVNLTDSDIYRYHWESDYKNSDTEIKHWAQVDLLKPYNIKAVGLHTWGAANDQMTNFRILASNSANFRSYRVLLDWGDHSRAMGSMNIYGTGGRLAFTNPPTQAYRYVRYEQKGTTGAAMGDIAVFSDDDGPVLSKAETVNNKISNNYISNVGLRYADGLGVQTFYTRNVEVSNNVIRNVPYSGISIGWGWENAKVWGTNSVGANTVLNNKIERSLRYTRDGAAIYIVGEQPGLLVEGNYIRDTKNSFGGIYPDNGAAGTQSARMIIRKNVVEDGPMWLHAWHPSGEYIDFTGNYTTVSRQKIDVNMDTCTASENYLYVKANAPAQANAIMDAAGITQEYDSVYRRAAQFGENTGKIDLTRLEMQLGLVNLADTFTLSPDGEPTAEETVDDLEYWCTHSNKTLSASLRPTYNAFKTEHLEAVLATYNYYKILLDENPGWLTGYETEYNELKTVIKQVQTVYNTSSPESIRVIYQARINGEKALDTFMRCGIFYGKTGTTRLLDSALINQIGYDLSR